MSLLTGILASSFYRCFLDDKKAFKVIQSKYAHKIEMSDPNQNGGYHLADEYTRFELCWWVKKDEACYGETSRGVD